MRTVLWRVCVACVVVVAAASLGLSGPVSGDTPPGSETIAIAVAPGTIALDSATTCLTVHADIAHGLVAEVEVIVNGTVVPVWYTKADSLGDLVVKVRIQAVKDAIGEAPSATVVLDGITEAGEPFTGSDTVKVTGGSRR